MGLKGLNLSNKQASRPLDGGPLDSLHRLCAVMHVALRAHF